MLDQELFSAHYKASDIVVDTFKGLPKNPGVALVCPG